MRTRIRAELHVAVLLAGMLAAVGVPAASASAATRAVTQPHVLTAPQPGHPGQGLVPGLPPGAARNRPALPGARLVPKPGIFSFLAGVYCVRASDCWAVGDYGTAHQGDRNEVLHWNGKSWRTFAVPSPGGHTKNSISDLFSVRCTGTKNCWAVGYYTGRRADLNQALHWNGSRWSKVRTPNPAGTTSARVNELFDVTCLSASRCWAVGEDGRQGMAMVARNEVLRWNGHAWSSVRVPQPVGSTSPDFNFLNGIRCSSASRCLAVGADGTASVPITLRNEVLGWNGTRWSLQKTPQPGGTLPGNVNFLVGLTCASATSCWAAGADGTYSSPMTLVNEVLHWNGTKWRLSAVPDPDGTGSGAVNQLNGAFCANSRDCWAVGEYGSVQGGTGTILTEAVHWNGAKWSRVKTPNPAGTGNQDNNELFSVRCARPDNCWAVGQSQGSSGRSRNLLLHWNGKAWSVH